MKGALKMAEMKQDIFHLMGCAMRDISAVGKDSVNQTQGFKYRGIDAVMNALYPVMSKYGLFVTPEVLEQTREERTTTKNVWDKDQKKYVEKKSTLLYSILKIKYTMYAPDGSSVSCVVVGEGMDSGDKASNKALAVGLKYACFQMFMIPTEEFVDPDSESPEVDPKPSQLEALAAERARIEEQNKKNPKADVEQTNKLPNTSAPKAEEAPKTTSGKSPVLVYLAKEREALRVAREMSEAENKALWNTQIKALIAAKMAPDKPLSAYTMEEARALIGAMYSNFEPTGTEIKKA